MEAPARRDEGADEAVCMALENVVVAEMAGVIGACVDMSAAYPAQAKPARFRFPSYRSRLTCPLL